VKFPGQGFQKLAHEQDKQTVTDATENITTASFAGDSEPGELSVTSSCFFFSSSSLCVYVCMLHGRFQKSRFPESYVYPGCEFSRTGRFPKSHFPDSRFPDEKFNSGKRLYGKWLFGKRLSGKRFIKETTVKRVCVCLFLGLKAKD